VSRPISQMHGQSPTVGDARFPRTLCVTDANSGQLAAHRGSCDTYIPTRDPDPRPPTPCRPFPPACRQAARRGNQAADLRLSVERRPGPARRPIVAGIIRERNARSASRRCLGC
jgi:hypothetical protein